MRITNEKKYNLSNGQVDYMSLINDLQDEYGTIYWNTLDDQVFIYRPLGRLEYKQLLNSEVSDIEKEDVICQACLLYPENFDFNDCLAGIPTELSRLILKNSFLDSLESKQLIVNYHRAEMQQFDNQITCIISEAFPNLDIEEIESWDMAKTAKYLSRAEWKLNILRQIPIDYETSDKMMAQEWNTQHSTGEEAQAEAPKTTEQKKDGNPRKKTAAEIAELKRKFPEINWDAEVDTSKVDINELRDSVDTTAPALRVGR